MLGAPEEHPVGSYAWAERMGQRLQIVLENVERTEQRELKYLPPVLEAILDAKPHPWTIWPEDAPARTPERWFEIITGQRIASVAKLVEAHDPASPLIGRLHAAAAEAEPMKEREGRPDKLDPRSSFSTRKHGPNTNARITRRLQRDHKDLFAAVQAGTMTPRAAGKAAGFIQPPTPLVRLRSAWKTASADERATFLEEIKL